MRLFTNAVQFQLKSWDSRIPGFHLDLKNVYEFQLRAAVSKFGVTTNEPPQLPVHPCLVLVTI
jgi:hypothetical protein